MLKTQIINQFFDLLVSLRVENSLIWVPVLLNFDLHVKVDDSFTLIIDFELSMVDFERLHLDPQSSKGIQSR